MGETVDIVIGWGHKYVESKTDQEVKEETVKNISAVDPDGNIVELERKSPSLFQLKIDKPGVYFVTAGIKPGTSLNAKYAGYDKETSGDGHGHGPGEKHFYESTNG